MLARHSVLAALLSASAAASVQALTQRHLVFAPGSDWEFAFDFATEACPNINPRDGVRGDMPDSMPIAWYNRAAQKSSLISATSQGIHASTAAGPTLDGLARTDCKRVVFNSSFELTPNSYANHQWLQSVRLLRNGSAYGLVHNEFKPELVGGPEYNSTCPLRTLRKYCTPRHVWDHQLLPSSMYEPAVLTARWCRYCPCVLTKSCAQNSGCELWSTGLAVSHDHGETFTLVATPANKIPSTTQDWRSLPLLRWFYSGQSDRPVRLQVGKPPAHVVFTLPSQYTNDQKLAGYGAVGTMLPGSDGAFFSSEHVIGHYPSWFCPIF
jgi:hypothetical protein